MKFWSIFFTLLILCKTHLYGQDVTQGYVPSSVIKKNIDSLQQCLSQPQADTLQIQILNELSRAYRPLDQLKSVKIAQEALQQSRNIKYIKGEAISYLNIAFINDLQGLYDDAISNYTKAAKKSEQVRYTKGLAYSFNGIGIAYWNKQDYDNALISFKKSLAFYQELKEENRIAASYNNIGLLYTKMNKYDESLNYLNKSLEIKTKLGAIDLTVPTLNNIAITYRLKQAPDKALPYSLKSLEMAKSYKQLRRIKEATLTLSEIYADLAQYEKSYQYLLEHKIIADSINKEDKASVIAELQNKYEFTEKEKEIASLKQQNSLRNTIKEKEIESLNHQNNLRTTIYIISLVFITLLVIGLILRMNYKQKVYKLLKQKNVEIKQQKSIIEQTNEELIALNENLEDMVTKRTQMLTDTNQQLQEAYEEVDEYVYRASHDFRSPLCTLMGLAQLGNQIGNENERSELFNQIYITSLKMDSMLRKLTSLHIINRHNLFIEGFNLSEMIQTICQRLDKSSFSKEYQIIIEEGSLSKILGDKIILEIVLENLLENALCFTLSKPVIIRINASVDEKEHYSISITDNGQGITPEYQEKIFDMFVRASESSQGNGLGLYIVKKAMNLLSGQVTVISKPRQFTCFTITYASVPNPALETQA